MSHEKGFPGKCVPPKTVIWICIWNLKEVQTLQYGWMDTVWNSYRKDVCYMSSKYLLHNCFPRGASSVETYLPFIPESADRFVFCNFSAIVQRLSRNKKKSGVCYRRIECEKKEHLVSPRTTRKPFSSTGWTERAFYNQMCIIPQPAIHNITNIQCVHWRHRRVICAGLWRKSFYIRECLKNPGQWGMRYSHVSWTLNTSAQLKAAFSALLPCPLIIQ